MIELPRTPIDRQSPVPFYFQLAEILEQEIAEGHWEAGLRIPSEPDLCAHFGVSRTTVRQALARLEQGGLIDRRKGRGTYVQDRRTAMWLLQSSEGFFQDEVDRLGRTVTSTILRAERSALPAWACSALEVPANSEGGVLERLRSIDGRVALYVVNYLAGHVADAALMVEDPNESLYRRLHDHAGVEARGGRRTLEAITVPVWIADLLELDVGAPVAFIESVAWDASMRPFDCYRAWLRTDRTRIDIQVSGSATTAVQPLAAHGLVRI